MLWMDREGATLLGGYVVDVLGEGTGRLFFTGPDEVSVLFKNGAMRHYGRAAARALFRMVNW